MESNPTARRVWSRSALRQVGSNLRYTGRDRCLLGRAAHDPEQTNGGIGLQGYTGRRLKLTTDTVGAI